MIEFACPRCGKSITVADDAAAALTVCHACRAKVRVPEHTEGHHDSFAVPVNPLNVGLAGGLVLLSLWVGWSMRPYLLRDQIVSGREIQKPTTNEPSPVMDTIEDPVSTVESPATQDPAVESPTKEESPSIPTLELDAEVVVARFKACEYEFGPLRSTTRPGITSARGSKRYRSCELFLTQDNRVEGIKLTFNFEDASRVDILKITETFIVTTDMLAISDAEKERANQWFESAMKVLEYDRALVGSAGLRTKLITQFAKTRIVCDRLVTTPRYVFEFRPIDSPF